MYCNRLSLVCLWDRDIENTVKFKIVNTGKPPFFCVATVSYSGRKEEIELTRGQSVCLPQQPG